MFGFNKRRLAVPSAVDDFVYQASAGSSLLAFKVPCLVGDVTGGVHAAGSKHPW